MFFTSLSRTTLAVCLFWTYIRITWHFSALRIIDIDIIDIFSAPRVWNSLPISIHESQSLPTFRRHLKTFYFQSAYPFQLPTLPRILSSTRPESTQTLALYKSFTYLFTYWTGSIWVVWKCSTCSCFAPPCMLYVVVCVFREMWRTQEE